MEKKTARNFRIGAYVTVAAVVAGAMFMGVPQKIADSLKPEVPAGEKIAVINGTATPDTEDPRLKDWKETVSSIQRATLDYNPTGIWTSFAYENGKRNSLETEYIGIIPSTDMYFDSIYDTADATQSILVHLRDQGYRLVNVGIELDDVETDEDLSYEEYKQLKMDEFAKNGFVKANGDVVEADTFIFSKTSEPVEDPNRPPSLDGNTQSDQMTDSETPLSVEVTSNFRQGSIRVGYSGTYLILPTSSVLHMDGFQDTYTLDEFTAWMDKYDGKRCDMPVNILIGYWETIDGTQYCLSDEKIGRTI
jgi:hypothetical protein